jgi:tRNA(Arg) A34 adenosine deaminase TadA
VNLSHEFVSRFELALPAWVQPFLSAWDAPLDSPTARVRLAVALSAENVRQATGGPFGAIVVEQSSGELLGVGVNLVTSSGLSMAHAEMVAISLAQEYVDSWNLGDGMAVQLVTSCEPCAMCFGAVPWSGVGSLVWGARRADAEAAGFDEGDKPADWERSLENRGIRTCGGVLRKEAAAVLADYAGGDGAIYNP